MSDTAAPKASKAKALTYRGTVDFYIPPGDGGPNILVKPGDTWPESIDQSQFILDPDLWS